jgi:hypothetical protein
VKRRDPAGLLVDRWVGWLVRHEPSGLPITPSLRLRRHAQAAMADLAATRVDFTRSAEDLRGTADLRRAQQAAIPWYERARVCCADGEHYSPRTYVLPSGRCSSERNAPRGRPRW